MKALIIFIHLSNGPYVKACLHPQDFQCTSRPKKDRKPSEGPSYTSIVLGWKVALNDGAIHFHYAYLPAEIFVLTLIFIYPFVFNIID